MNHNILSKIIEISKPHIVWIIRDIDNIYGNKDRLINDGIKLIQEKLEKNHHTFRTVFFKYISNKDNYINKIAPKNAIHNRLYNLNDFLPYNQMTDNDKKFLYEDYWQERFHKFVDSIVEMGEFCIRCELGMNCKSINECKIFRDNQCSPIFMIIIVKKEILY